MLLDYSFDATCDATRGGLEESRLRQVNDISSQDTGIYSNGFYRKMGSID
jgi:hypothetical protein